MPVQGEAHTGEWQTCLGVSGSASLGFEPTVAYDFGFGRARRSKIESGSTPLGALCEKPKEVSSRRKRPGAGPLGAGALAPRKQLGSGPLALEQLGSGALALALIRGRVSLVLAAAVRGLGARGRGRAKLQFGVKARDRH